MILLKNTVPVICLMVCTILRLSEGQFHPLAQCLNRCATVYQACNGACDNIKTCEACRKIKNSCISDCTANNRKKRHTTHDQFREKFEQRKKQWAKFLKLKRELAGNKNILH